jgi:hypothetical protein
MFMIKNKKRFWGKVLLIVSLLLGGILISEPSEKDVHWLHVRSNYAFDHNAGYEYQDLCYSEEIAVVRIIRKKREYYIKESEANHSYAAFICTIFVAEVEDVLYGSLKKGQRIYIYQSGNSSIRRTDGGMVGLIKDCSMVDETGGFYQRGERLLVSMSQVKQIYSGKSVQSIASYLNLTPAIPVYSTSLWSHRTVSADGTLAYRTGTLYQPGQIGYQYTRPYWDNYRTVEEIRNAIPELFLKSAEFYDAPITKEELEVFSRNHFAKVSGIITQGLDEWKAFVEEYRAKRK